jgi:hypothetical protein
MVRKAIGIVVFALCAGACAPAGDAGLVHEDRASLGTVEAQSAPVNVGLRVGELCERTYAALRRRYRSDPAAHLRVTAGYLRMIRGLPIDALHTCEAILARHIAADGIGPYLGVVSEHAHRLAKLPDRLHERRLTDLSNVAGRALKREVASMATATDPVLIRAYRDRGYLPVSENAARAVVGVQISPAGRKLAAAGATATGVLKLVEVYRQCAQARPPRDAQGLRAYLQCLALVHELRQANPDGKPHLLGMADAASLLAGGMWKAQSACLASLSTDVSSKMIAALEEQAACKRSQVGTPGDGMTPSGLMDAAAQEDYDPKEDGPEEIKKKLEGLVKTDESHEEYAGENVVARIDTYTYTDPSDPSHTIQIVEYSLQKGETWAESTSQTGTIVIEESGLGTTVTSYDEDMDVVTEHVEGSGENHGSASQTTHAEDGSRSEVVRHAHEDTFEVTEYDPQGNVKKRSKYDVLGKCIEGCEDPARMIQRPTTPLHDHEVFPCAGDLANDLLGPVRAFDPLDLYVIPAPDSVEGGFSDACLEAVIAGRRPACPPSVALCTDPWITSDRCDCVPGANAPDPGLMSPNCAYVDCGEDATCDPETGMCQLSSSSFVFPGVLPPVSSLQP